MASDEKRFHAARLDSGVEVVLSVPPDEFNKLDAAGRQGCILVRIKTDTMISPKLARVWTEDIADKLNQFDIANAAVAKIST